MKNLILLLICNSFALLSLAQSGTMLPDGFIIPNSSIAPSCTNEEKGKLYFNSTTDLMMLCNGTTWQTASNQWFRSFDQPNTLYYNGKVGINNPTPTYELDVNGVIKLGGNLLIDTKIGIGNFTQSQDIGLEVTDGDIAISSSADSKVWKFNYSDADDALLIQEDGISRMVFSNGGYVGIGSAIPTSALSVEGSGRFYGELTVNGSSGIVRSSSATQLKCHITQLNLGTSFSVAKDGCSTSDADLTAAAFTGAPTVQVGNKISGTGDFGKLIINVQSTTSTQAVVRFCNTTASDIYLGNMIFNLMCFGQ